MTVRLLLPLVTALAVLAYALPAAYAEESPATGDAGTLNKEDADRVNQKRPYSPYADRKFPTRLFFGDTHLHTSFLMDAGAAG